MPMNPGGVPNTTALPVVRSFTNTREQPGVDFIPRSSAFQIAAAVAAVWSSQPKPGIAAVLDDFVPRSRSQASALSADSAPLPRVDGASNFDDFIPRLRSQAQDTLASSPIGRTLVASFAPDPVVVPDYVPPPERFPASPLLEQAIAPRVATPQDDFVPGPHDLPAWFTAPTTPIEAPWVASIAPDPVVPDAYVPPPASPRVLWSQQPTQTPRMQLAAVAEDFVPTRVPLPAQPWVWPSCALVPTGSGALFDPGPLTTGYVPSRRGQPVWAEPLMQWARSNALVQDEFVAPSQMRGSSALGNQPAPARSWIGIIDPGPVVYVPPPSRVLMWRADESRLQLRGGFTPGDDYVPPGRDETPFVDEQWQPDPTNFVPIIEDTPPPPPTPYPPTPTTYVNNGGQVFASAVGGRSTRSLLSRMLTGQLSMPEPPSASSAAEAATEEIEAELIDEELDAATRKP